MQSEYQTITDFLSRLGEVYITIKEYRITHGYLHLLLTDKNFHVMGQLLLFDCYFLSGQTSSGGPYRIGLRKICEENQEVIVVFSVPDGFIAKGLRIDMTNENWRANLL